jgi:hypothetical protein
MSNTKHYQVISTHISKDGEGNPIPNKVFILPTMWDNPLDALTSYENAKKWKDEVIIQQLSCWSSGEVYALTKTYEEMIEICQKHLEKLKSELPKKEEENNG